MLRSEQSAAASELAVVLAHRKVVREELQTIPVGWWGSAVADMVEVVEETIEESQVEAVRVMSEIDETKEQLRILKPDSDRLEEEEVVEEDEVVVQLSEAKRELDAAISDAEVFTI